MAVEGGEETMSAVIERLSESLWIVKDGDTLIGSLLLSEKQEGRRRVKEYLVLSADHDALGTTGTLLGGKRLLTGEPAPVSPMRRAIENRNREHLPVAS